MYYIFITQDNNEMQGKTERIILKGLLDSKVYAQNQHTLCTLLYAIPQFRVFLRSVCGPQMSYILCPVKGQNKKSDNTSVGQDIN